MSDSLRETVVDEIDLAIVNCLQIDPRAPWSLVGEVVGVDPATASRRWLRLSGDGTAWITGRAAGHGGAESCLAVIEVTCDAPSALAIARRVAEFPHVFNIEHTSGPRSLTMLANMRDMAALSDFLLGDLARIPGVLGTRSHVVIQVVTMGDQWRLRTLDRQQIATMNRHRRKPDRPRASVRAYDQIDRKLILLLGEDGRMPVGALARRCGISESTARRRLVELIADERVILRCDMSLAASGWPLIVWVWGTIDGDDSVTVGALLRHVPGLRVLWRIVGGRADTLLAISAHSIQEVPAIETALAEHAPGLTVLDRSVVLRSIKRVGRELDASGRAVRAVPMDIWST
ncbi:Lrp/AsnC family transcriptional regulator [Tsukamurella sp. PLM1]|uniref:Lrp/AsnC family transcriptional regulator n=1 Tax=Tsukamurella sp. PLM1 TaxID=2929795 RepID=UPI0020BFC0C3|nr:Lrp/AsnC family transcriptional regulator [Tsukamurella sp. PLM1]